MPHLTRLTSLRYGKPLKSSVIDQMMLEGDHDFDGEISLIEFQILMLACEQQDAQQGATGKVSNMWSSIAERGLVVSKELKVSEDMRLRRIKDREKRIVRNERLLNEAAAEDPDLFTTVRWMPPEGSQSPPVRLPPSPNSPAHRTYDVRETLRRLPWSKDRGDKAKDLESALLLDLPDDIDDVGWFKKLWMSLPSPAEAAATAFDFLDNYAPLIALLAIPTSALIKYVRRQINAYLTPPGYVAPPPPPASPDWMKAAEDSFFELAQERSSHILSSLVTPYAPTLPW